MLLLDRHLHCLWLIITSTTIRDPTTIVTAVEQRFGLRVWHRNRNTTMLRIRTQWQRTVEWFPCPMRRINNSSSSNI